MKILIFGDSITEGYNDYINGGWTNMLKKDLTDTSKNIEVLNFGISGDDVTDIISRFEITVKHHIGDSDEEIIFIFAVGINDTITNVDESYYAYTSDEFKSNYEELLDTAKKYSTKIYMLGLTIVDEDLVSPFDGSSTGKCYKNNRIKEFDEIIRNIADKYNNNFIEMLDVLEKIYLDDGLHPNSIGHSKILKKVKENINKF